LSGVWVWFVVGLVGVVVVQLVSAVIILRVLPATEEHGTFGDMFGALNTLFSGWAFLGLIFTLLLQRQQLEEQRQEIRDARIAQQQSAESLRWQAQMGELVARLDALNHIVAVYDHKIERLEREAPLSSDERLILNQLKGLQNSYEGKLQELIDRILAFEQAEDGGEHKLSGATAT